MLETRFKIAMLLAVVFLTSLPVMGILRGTTPPPQDPLPQKYETRSGLDDGMGYDVEAKPIPEELIHIEPGYFDLGTMTGGFDEKPQRKIYLDGYFIDKFEVTNHQYLEFSQV